MLTFNNTGPVIGTSPARKSSENSSLIRLDARYHVEKEFILLRGGRNTYVTLRRLIRECFVPRDPL